ncbi:Anti-sigma F factor antagonist (spoIIAA-2), Anti-sigma B factor antagonist RsbV [Rubellimicrobium mesophilum DSM 19309]|uniref:Anti-sigma factor antagonist n=1 Tax=Rubellimicrobium mesophilum DSM 19309 TaxID=442562 RepID=A0A017HPF7_9RHOB|nr:STAS domain-containing protein [Rubellimicrobium mesophilum]EYD76387.1 Anti-sigma F factor antagonist (spoIIAA-2), Anti-sigma B factor antagonist RsbV [Rubellimicrobium mesophilum DSM 19309]
MNITEELQSDILVLHVGETRVDAARAPALRDELLRRIDAGHSRIVLDLSKTDFMDSSGLGALVSAVKRLGSRGTLAIVGASGAVARLFQLTRMDRVFALHPSVDAAIAQMSG